ncbi:MAG: hypothetical protein J0H49_06785 [Acidobacteria bacterium]|nr:hypothetical protein [Acidobacteriota bacterium]
MRYVRQFTMVALVLAASARFLAAQDPPGRVARLNYREGDVSFQPNGVDDWADARINRPLTTGDKIWVGDRGRAELHVGSMALRLGERSDFEFLNLDDQTVQIRLSEGTLLVRLRAIAPDQLLEIDTPNLAFTVRQPGIYRIDADPDAQTTFVTVRDGEGEVTGDGQSFPLYARQRVAVRGGDQLEYNLTSAAGGDAFDEWCSARDRREDQSQSARYVSREVPGYEDLDQYGSWVSQPEYGQVWMPASVSAGWAPYHDGHWAWIAPWGWTWVDDAPWGFAPYHYGRWASFGGRWGWIPGPYQVAPTYAPAMVAWVGGGGGSGFSLAFSSGMAPAVGWFPLGPREPYYPSYRVSQPYFTRVNTTNTVINNVTINNYYRVRNDRNSRIAYMNQRVENGVIAVPQSAFASGRRVSQFARPVSAAQIQAVHIAPGPFVVPQRTSLLGAQAESNARAVARPPAAALNRRVVARTAPPPPAVPFERQQAALARNAGRPLPANEVRRMGQAAPVAAPPVRVVDMSRVKRVQPAMRGEVRPGPQPGVPQPPANERLNVPSGQQPRPDAREAQQRDQQRQQQQEMQRQQQRQQQDAREAQQRQQQQEVQRQQQRQQQDAREAQQRQQQQEMQRQQQRQQQDAREAQQRQQQQEAQRQQQRQQQDAREAQQRQQQQEMQRQQQRQQQEAREAQQRQQQQEAQRQQQRQQQEAREAQQRRQQQEAQRQQQRQQQEAREAQQRQRPAPHTPPAPRPEPRKEQKPPPREEKNRN